MLWENHIFQLGKNISLLTENLNALLIDANCFIENESGKIMGNVQKKINNMMTKSENHRSLVGGKKRGSEFYIKMKLRKNF